MPLVTVIDLAADEDDVLVDDVKNGGVSLELPVFASLKDIFLQKLSGTGGEVTNPRHFKDVCDDSVTSIVPFSVISLLP